MHTVPDRSNLTRNALLERCRNAKISVELKRVLNKNAFYYAFHREHDNMFH